MNILCVGAGQGSWTIRGQQLGAAIGARVLSAPDAADWRWADVCILHKKYAVRYASAAHLARVPIVWDALDFWAQPGENGLGEADAIGVLRAHMALIRPLLVMGATQAMADAAGGVYLPHHHWSGLAPIPARERVHVVAYQGNAAYLGSWLGLVSRACARRGWRFVVNPADLREADLLVAFRDGPWDGWICRHWKSGVKLVNAIAAGRPILTQPSAAASEIGAPGSLASSEQELEQAFDQWADYTPRALAVEACRSFVDDYALMTIARRYQQILQDVRARCAA